MAEMRTGNDFCRIWYLSSNDTIANIVLRDLDLLFVGYNWKRQYLETARAKRKNAWRFLQILISADKNETIAKVVPRGIYQFLFEGKKLEMFISRTLEVALNCKMTVRRLPGNVTTFLFSKMQMISKLFLQICIRLYGTRRRVAPVTVRTHVSRNSDLCGIHAE